MTSKRRPLAIFGALVASLFVFPVAQATAAPQYLDPAFGDDGVATLSLPPTRDVEVAPSGRIVFTLARAATAASPDVAAVTSTGELDDSFGDGGTVRLDPSSTYSAQSVIVDTDGRILVLARGGVWRLLPNGGIDTSYGADGFSDLSEFGLGSVMNLRPGGGVLVAGSEGQNLKVTQLGVDGSIDRTFGTNGLGLLSVARTSPTGPRVTASEVASSPDGGAVIGATVHGYLVDSPHAQVGKLDADGQPDIAFSPSVVTPGVTSSLGTRGVAGMVVLDTGAIVIAGSGGSGGTPGSPNFWIVQRLTPDGEYDTSFQGDGRTAIPLGSTNGSYPGYTDETPVADLVRLEGGRYVVVGQWGDRGSSGEESWAAAELTSDGRLVEDYGSGGVVEDRSGRRWTPSSAALDQDGTIVLAGGINGATKLGRLLTEPEPSPGAGANDGGGAAPGEVSAGPGLEILSSRVPRRLSKLAAKGVTVRARCAVDCRVFIRVVIPKKQARRLGLSSPVIAGAERNARAGRTVKLVSRLSKTAKLRLLAANPKVLRLRIDGSADTRQPSVR